MRRYRFFAHFNRVNMQRGNPRVWTVHFRGQCIQAKEVDFQTLVRTRYRPASRQPRAVLVGEATDVRVSSAGIATVYA